MAFGEPLHLVGELIFEVDGRRETSMFRYATEWLDNPERFAVAPAMPLGEMPFYGAASRENRRSALPGPVADSAPDAWGRGLIRNTHQGGARRGVPTELDYLLAVDDATRQGALRYLDEGGLPTARCYPPTPRLSELAELRLLAAAAAKSDSNWDASMRHRLLGSARPKANVRDEDGALAIAKFASDDDAMPVERMEAATLLLACATGIDAASARLELGATDKPVALIKRFDRANRLSFRPVVPWRRDRHWRLLHGHHRCAAGACL